MKLYKAEILFHDPIDAANKVNSIWEDVQGWWMESKRQEARLKFMKSFDWADSHWQERWRGACKVLARQFCYLVVTNKNIKSLFITLPQRNLPCFLPPFGAMAVINSLCKSGYKDTFLYNIVVSRPTRDDAIEYIGNYKPDILCISITLGLL